MDETTSESRGRSIKRLFFFKCGRHGALLDKRSDINAYDSDVLKNVH